MANYTPTFTKPYPSGWVDKPSKTTPVTAAIMDSYDTAIAALESYLRDNAIKNVSANTTVKSGTKIATITIDGTEYVLYSPSVSYESAITGGTKVGTITVGANTFDVYAPASSAGGSTVSVVPKTLTGTNIAEITVDGTTYQLYAPTGGGSGSTVTAEATLTEGTQIGKITIDGVETILYAPTASPITVDTELSVTSENAVQNKAIAEEFQKYANGTKIVAKATEADTATTASNAEKVNGHTVGADVPSNAVFTDTVYDDSAVKASIQNIVNGTTQVGSATKATQDAQGNTIDTTYAKKTEVPQGTVVDDALSSTSVNPVQNKVVKAEFDSINSNLDGLGYGENGAYNLLDLSKLQTIGFSIEEGNITNITTDARTNFIFYVSLTKKDGTYTFFVTENILQNESKDFTFSIPSGYEKMTMKHNGSSKDILIASFNISDFGLKENDTITVHISVSSSNPTVVGGIVIKELAIVKGDTFIGYKPYIPSVKMLTEEVNQQNESLADYGLDNVYDGKWIQDGEAWITTEDYISANENDIVVVKCDTVTSSGGFIVQCFNSSSETAIQTLNSLTAKEAKFTLPSGTTRIKVRVGNPNLTPETVGRIGVYVNNAIDSIKNDLDKLNSLPIGSIIQIDEDKDDIETTTQKYGWQYLGKSNIQYEIGSANILVTNVYRKNN